jgi:hypothetical protein
MMIPEPRAWESCWPHLFRLPGFGGAAVFMRTVLVPQAKGQEGAIDSPFAVDLSILTPVSLNSFLGRPTSPGFVQGLCDFFLTGAADWHPEVSVSSFQDERLGLEVSITSSTESVVELVVNVVQDPEADVKEFATLNFETSRSALAQASFDIRQLDGSADFL